MGTRADSWLEGGGLSFVASGSIPVPNRVGLELCKLWDRHPGKGGHPCTIIVFGIIAHEILKMVKPCGLHIVSHGGVHWIIGCLLTKWYAMLDFASSIIPPEPVFQFPVQTESSRCELSRRTPRKISQGGVRPQSFSLFSSTSFSGLHIFLFSVIFLSGPYPRQAHIRFRFILRKGLVI